MIKRKNDADDKKSLKFKDKNLRLKNKNLKY